jgi:hypothetical protein
VSINKFNVLQKLVNSDGMPPSFYEELLYRYQADEKPGDILLDMAPEMSLLGEIASSNRLKYRYVTFCFPFS